MMIRAVRRAGSGISPPGSSASAFSSGGGISAVEGSAFGTSPSSAAAKSVSLGGSGAHSGVAWPRPRRLAADPSPADSIPVTPSSVLSSSSSRRRNPPGGSWIAAVASPPPPPPRGAPSASKLPYRGANTGSGVGDVSALAALPPGTAVRLEGVARGASGLGDEALLNAVSRDKLLCLFLQPAELLRVIKLAAPFDDVAGHTIPWVSTLYRFIGRSVSSADWGREANVEALASLSAWLAEDRSPRRKKAVLHALTWTLPPVITRALEAGALSPPQVAKLAWAYGRGLVSPRVEVWPAVVAYTQRHLTDMSTGDLARVLWAVAEGHYVGKASPSLPIGGSSGSGGGDGDHQPALALGSVTSRDSLFSSAAAHLTASLEARSPNAASVATVAAAYAIGGLPSPPLMAVLGGRATSLMMVHLPLTPAFRALVLSEPEPSSTSGVDGLDGSGAYNSSSAAAPLYDDSAAPPMAATVAAASDASGWWMRDQLDLGLMATRTVARAQWAAAAAAEAAAAADAAAAAEQGGFVATPSHTGSAALAVAAARQQQLSALALASSGGGGEDAAGHSSISGGIDSGEVDAAAAAVAVADTAAPPDASSRPARVETPDARAFVTIAWALLQQRAWDGAFFAVFRRLYPRMATQASRAPRDVARLVAVNLGVALLSPFPHLSMGRFTVDEEAILAAGGRRAACSSGADVAGSGSSGSSARGGIGYITLEAGGDDVGGWGEGSGFASPVSPVGEGGRGDADEEAASSDYSLDSTPSSLSCRGGGGGGRMLLVPEGLPPPASPSPTADPPPPPRPCGVALLAPSPQMLREGVPLRDPLGRPVRGELTAVSHAAAALRGGIAKALPSLRVALASAVADPSACDVYGPYVASCGLVFDFALPALKVAVLVVTPKFMAPSRDAVSSQMLTYAELAGAAGWDVHLVPATELRRHNLEADAEEVGARLVGDVRDGWWSARGEQPAAGEPDR